MLEARYVSVGSWPRENADALRRRRIAFSSVRCSSFSREAPPLHARRCSGAEISKSPRFLRFWCPGHILAFMLLCVEPRVIWGLVGIGFQRFLIRTRFHAARVTNGPRGHVRSPSAYPLRAE